MQTILSIFSRFPPWIETVLLAITVSLGCVLPDYAFALDHAPTAYVCVDTSKAELVEAPVPMAIVLARNRSTADERVDTDIMLRSTSSATNRDRSSDSGMSNPLKRWLC